MLVGKVLDHENKQTHHKYLANNPEICWRFLFHHRNAARVVICDEAGAPKLEMEGGVLVWPRDSELQDDIQARFVALQEAELIATAS